MLSLNPKDLSIRDRHHHLLNGIGPRPIAWVSTIDKVGNVNLAPFSFFNLVSSNPPILVFSPARRGRDNTTKHTLDNLSEVAECVVNIVNHDLLNQMVLTSLDYPQDVNEMEQAGLKAIESEMIQPPRIENSPMQLECRVQEIKSLGSEGASGNLVIAEVVKIHIRDEYLGEHGFIDQQKIDLVGRLGEAWYTRAHGTSLFEVHADVTKVGIGFRRIPKDILKSDLLTGNDLAKLAMVESLPDESSVNDYKLIELADIFLSLESEPEKLRSRTHELAKEKLTEGDVMAAWKTLLSYND